jgi:putative pyruvate formate lyase activating enzyme
MSFPPIYLSAAVVHLGEEPPIGGDRGVGNLFLSGCNLRCCFCQNHQASHHPRRGEALSPERCAERIVALAASGAEAIGLVSPTHQARSVARAVELARLNGLSLPVVYNSNGTDGPQVLARFDGLVDVYLPDFKYGSDAIAWELSRVRNYVHRARRAVREMHRQVGHLPDDQALHHARRGLIVRHLVMPGGLAGTSRVMRLLAEDLGEALWLSLMAQYVPEPLTYIGGGAAAVTRFPELGRTITAAEYEEALDAARLAGLTRLFTQDLATSPTTGLPDFDRAEPFLWDA